jgi:hypothetical protein
MELPFKHNWYIPIVAIVKFVLNLFKRKEKLQ